MSRNRAELPGGGFREPPTFTDALQAGCDDPELIRNFLAELCSPREREWFEQRWRTAHFLIQGENRRGLQAEVARAVGTDPKTVGHAARWALGDLRVKRPGADRGATQEIFAQLEKASAESA